MLGAWAWLSGSVELGVDDRVGLQEVRDQAEIINDDKGENWRIAREMRWEDIENTDLGQFLERL
jgi:hypothetical protein